MKIHEYNEMMAHLTRRRPMSMGGRVGFDKGGIAKVVEYINSLPDGTEVSTKDIRDFIEKNNINASPTSIRNIIAGSAPGRERFKDTIKFVDQKGVVKFNEETFKKIDELLENPKITSFRELGKALGYKTPKPSGQRGVTVGGGTPLSRNSAIMKAYAESRGGDPFEVFKVGAYKRGQPLVEKVLELQAKGDSTNTIAQKLFKGNRTNVRRIFRLFRPEAIKSPTPKADDPTTTIKTRASARRQQREAKAFKKVGKKTAEQTKEVINTIKDKNADILKMSDSQILNDPKIRYSMSIDATGLKLGEPIKFNKNLNLSDKEFVKKVKEKAKNKLFYTPEHISEVAKEKLNTAFPNNIVNAPGRMTSQIGLIKTYLRNNPTGEFAKQADEVLKQTGMQFKTEGKTFGVKENIVFDSKTNKSNIVENYFKKPSGTTLGSTMIQPELANLDTPAARNLFSSAGKIALGELGFAGPSIVLDTYAGLTPSEMALNVATFGFGTPIKDSVQKRKFIADAGFGSDYSSALTKRRNLRTAPEDAVGQLTDREKQAIFLANAFDARLDLQRAEQAADYQQRQQSQLKRGELEIPDYTDVPEATTSIQPEFQEETTETRSLPFGLDRLLPFDDDEII